jgi:hypothetical protein
MSLTRLLEQWGQRTVSSGGKYSIPTRDLVGRGEAQPRREVFGRRPVLRQNQIANQVG